MSQEQLSSQINIFHTIFIVCLVTFILLLLLTLFLFFRLDIIGVIGYLTGKTERKIVQQMVEGEKSGEIAHSQKKKTKKNQKIVGKNTDNTIMTPSGQLKKPGSDEVMLSTGSSITDVLGGDKVTDPMSLNELKRKTRQDSDKLASRKIGRHAGDFVIEKQIIFINTEEIINSENTI